MQPLFRPPSARPLPRPRQLSVGPSSQACQHASTSGRNARPAAQLLAGSCRLLRRQTPRLDAARLRACQVEVRAVPSGFVRGTPSAPCRTSCTSRPTTPAHRSHLQELLDQTTNQLGRRFALGHRALLLRLLQPTDERAADPLCRAPRELGSFST